MNAVTLNLTLKRGIVFLPIMFAFKAAPDEEAEPVDLTGWIPYAHVRKSISAPVTLDLNPQLTDPASGEVTIPGLTDEQTADLPVGIYMWDIILQNTLGDRLGPFVGGEFRIELPPVTQPS